MGGSDDRPFAVVKRRDIPYFIDTERAALALTEAATRRSDCANSVPGDIWNETVRHYAEQSPAALVVNIALINSWNRINVITRQMAGARVR